MNKLLPAATLACVLSSSALAQCPVWGSGNSDVISVCSTMNGRGESGFCAWNNQTGSAMSGLVWQLAEPQAPDTWRTIETGDITINGHAAALHVTCWDVCLAIDSSTAAAVGAKLRTVRIDPSGQCPMLIGPSVTIQSRACCGQADMGSRGGEPGADGYLDNNDFIVYINYFFSFDARGDVGICGGTPGSDGLWDNNDFIVFINHFFTDGVACTH